MGYRRGVMEIKRDILHVCLKPRKVTEILRLANIQFNSLGNHLDSLIKADLISRINHQGNDQKTKYVYETTSEGKQVLQEIEALADRICLEWRKPEVFY